MSTPSMPSHSRFHHDVFHSLVRRGHEPSKAATIAQVVGHTKVWIDAHIEDAKDLKTGAKGAYDAYDKGKTFVAAGRLIRNPMMANAATKIGKVQNIAGAGVLRGAVDVLEVAAKHEGVELNKCSLSVSKVALDGVVVTAEAATVETGVGAVLFALSVKGAKDDVVELVATCFDAHIPH